MVTKSVGCRCYSFTVLWDIAGRRSVTKTDRGVAQSVDLVSTVSVSSRRLQGRPHAGIMTPSTRRRSARHSRMSTAASQSTLTRRARARQP